MKKLTALALCAVLLLGALPFSSAAQLVSVDEAAQVLAALEIMVGDENGNMMLTKAVSRSEFIKMAVAASTMKDNVGVASVSPYPDVSKHHWAAGYVQVGVQMGLINGYLDGTFRPDNTITLAEGVTIALRLLGYTDSDFSGAFPTGQMAQYRAMKLDKGITVQNTTDNLSRQDCLYLFYNLLTATNKQGMVHLNTLGYSLTANGEIDRVALINGAMEGPIIAEGNWSNSIPFSVTNAKVTRNGSAASYADIQTGDVVYYSSSMRALWVYHNRVYGTYGSAMPSAANPSSILIAGQSYSFETSAAAFEVSDLGSFKPGDAVVLYLGRNGAVAAVRSPEEVSGVQYGIVSNVFASSYQTADGESYTAKTVMLTATNGNSYTYPYSGTTLAAGDLVEVSFGTTGAIVSRMGKKTLSGTMNSAGTAIGSHKLSTDVEILDTYGNSASGTVYPSRLAGVTFTDAMVRSYATDASGTITHLILDDVTGDLHQYGVITSNVVVDGMIVGSTTINSQGVYMFDIAGTAGMSSFEGKHFGDINGPFMLSGSVSNPTRLKALTKVGNVSAVSGLSATIDGSHHLLSEDYVVYVRRGSDYYLSTWNQVSQDYVCTAYRDKTQSEGGRVRIIVATAK